VFFDLSDHLVFTRDKTLATPCNQFDHQAFDFLEVLRYAYINTRHRVVEDLLQLGAPFPGAMNLQLAESRLTSARALIANQWRSRLVNLRIVVAPDS
jgi:hypothetical protein